MALHAASVHASVLKWEQLLSSFRGPQILIGPFGSRAPVLMGFSLSSLRGSCICLTFSYFSLIYEQT